VTSDNQPGKERQKKQSEQWQKVKLGQYPGTGKKTSSKGKGDTTLPVAILIRNERDNGQKESGPEQNRQRVITNDGGED
jgi:hypothetical protein